MTDSDQEDVETLDRRAYFSISTSEGYVRIEQSTGDPPLYTPEQARGVAEDILEAVEELEG